MEDTLNILKAFENCIKQYCRPTYEKLGKSLGSNVITNSLEQIGIKKDQIASLYEWKNGIKLTESKFVGEFDFCSNGKMLPLEEAISVYQTYSKDSLWSGNFFPLFTTNAGDYLLYNMAENSETYGMLFFYSPSLLVVEPQSMYDDLEIFFETLIACYEQGVYRYNIEKNTLAIDQDKEYEISLQKNTKSEYWKEDKLF